MPLGIKIDDDIRAAKKIWLPWWGVLSWMALCLPVVWLLDHLGRLDLALPTLNCIAVLGFLIKVKWKLRRCAWFWITMTIIAALHVLLLLFIPWTTKWVPAIAIAAIDSADFIVVLAILSIVGKYLEGPTTTER